MITRTGKLKWLKSGDMHLKGELGKALQTSIRNRLCKINYRHLVDPFRFRSENDNAWRCEFWGKNIRGAILSWYLAPDHELEKIIRDTVYDMLSTQTPDGCISSYPKEKQLGGWDVWGRKYVLCGLCRFYNLVEKDQRIPIACAKMLDHLIGQLHEKNKPLAACAMHDGLPASSILDAVIAVYDITGEQRFLDFAMDIIKSGCTLSQNIFQAVMDGLPPKDIGNGKAYEMMSCFQGLVMLQNHPEHPEWKEINQKFFRMVRDRELFITGAAGFKDQWGEYWDDGTSQQTRTDIKDKIGLGETCVSATWLHFCNEMMMNTGKSEIADACERTIYNAVLGAMSPDGVLWTHRNPTPLAAPAPKLPSQDQMQLLVNIPYDGHDCCRAQGPEALAIAAAMCVLESTQDKAWYVNFYEQMDTSRFRMDGKYPFGASEMQITFTHDSAYPLYLRVSADLLKVTKNGKTLDLPASGWLCAGQSFHQGDVLQLNFDPQIYCEELNGFTAFITGPLVLAQDSRLPHTKVGEPIKKKLIFKRINASAPFRTIVQNEVGQMLCDYASAGSQFSAENTLQVWIKQTDY